MEDGEPVMDVAHLGHVELLTPKPEDSLRFFTVVMGIGEAGYYTRENGPSGCAWSSTAPISRRWRGYSKRGISNSPQPIVQEAALQPEFVIQPMKHR